MDFKPTYYVMSFEMRVLVVKTQEGSPMVLSYVATFNDEKEAIEYVSKQNV